MFEVGKVIKSHCNKCGPDINHIVRSQFEKKWSETERFHGEDYVIYGGNEYFVLECAGCHAIHTRKDSWCSEAQDPETGEYDVANEYYPPRIFRKKPDWMNTDQFKLSCPSQIVSLLDESYTCMLSDCLRSTAMAIRAILEELMLQKIWDQGNFKANLAAFKMLGYVSDKQLEIISAVVETGNASIHRGYKPKKEDLILCFDIAEQLTQMLFVHSQAEGVRPRNVENLRI